MRRLGRLSPGTLAALDCFLVLGLLGIYLKVAMLGPAVDGRSRASSVRPHPNSLGSHLPARVLRQRHLAQPAGDPGCGNADWSRRGVPPLPGGRRGAGGCGVLGIVYFVELQVQKEVGQYLSRDAVRDMLGWASLERGHHRSITSRRPVSGNSPLTLAFSAPSSSLARVAARSRDRTARARVPPALRSPRRDSRWPARLLSLPVALAARLPASPLTTSSVARAAAMLDRRRPDGETWR